MSKQPWEKEWAGSLLYLQKLEATTLCTTALESASDDVRNHAIGILNRSFQNQKGLFELMSRKGWYNVETAPREQYSMIQRSFNMMQSKLEDLQ